MNLFSSLAPAPKEPIFAIAEAAKKAGPDAINASIGIILDEHGKPLVLDCVRKALQEWEGKDDVTYPPLLGIPEFRKSVCELSFGSDETVASIAAAGGTGALTINLKLLHGRLGVTRVLVPSPSWPNHKRLLTGMGLEVVEAPYLEDGETVVEPMLKMIKEKNDPRMALLLHTSCHNPTGKSWSKDQWKQIAKELSGTEHPVLLDCAYQGLGEGMEEDVAAIEILKDAQVPLFFAWSASKNHTIYGLRTGLACTWTDSVDDKKKIEGHYEILTREVYSGAPVTGQRIVGTVQQKYQKEWQLEIKELRELLQKKRKMLSDAFPDWNKAIDGEGLFTILPLSPEQVDQLAQKRLFLTRDGRINIAGISLKKMERVVELISSVR